MKKSASKSLKSAKTNALTTKKKRYTVKKTDKPCIQRSKALIILTIVSALFTLLCYGFFLAASLTQSNGLLSCVVGVIAVTVSLGSIIFLPKMSYKLNCILCAGLTFFMVTFSVFVLAVNLGPSEKLPDGEYVMIVFGSYTNGYMPGRTLTTRLLSAYELMSDNPKAVCIVSGGQGKNETISEARSMKSFLVGRGIDESRIYEEAHSSDTIENLKYTADLLKSEGLDGLPIVFVSSSYHLPRISVIAKHYVGGIYAERKLYTVGSAQPSIYYFFSNNTREYLSWIKLGGRVISEAIGSLV